MERPAGLPGDCPLQRQHGDVCRSGTRCEQKVFLYFMAEALAVKVQKLSCLFLFLFPWKLKSSPTKLNEVFGNNQFQFFMIAKYCFLVLCFLTYLLEGGGLTLSEGTKTTRNGDYLQRHDPRSRQGVRLRLPLASRHSPRPWRALSSCNTHMKMQLTGSIWVVWDYEVIIGRGTQ